jgi:aubergine-like protein
VKSTFGYEISKPNIFYVDFRNQRDWIQKVEEVRPEIVLCLLQGQKGKGFNYNEIKRYLLQEKGIPSQMILLSTITKGKNLRSIINKVLMQMCAKVGGEPWAIDKMPFVDVPTCVASIDFFDKGNFPVMSVCLSVNKNFSRYCSVVIKKEPKHEDNIINAMKVIFENVYLY